MKYIVIVLISFSVFSCKQDKASSKEGLRKIKGIEDSLSRISAQSYSEVKMVQDLNKRLVNELIAFYRTFPEDKSAPLCLDKIHMKYAGMKMYKVSAAYGDTLIEKYPDYVNRAMVLESQAHNYNYFIVPRDKAKVRKYLSLLLQENPKMEKGKKDEIKFTLDNIDLSWEELIEKQAEQN